MRIQIVVRARASRRRIEPAADGVLRVSVMEPAEDGRENASVIEAMAEHFGVPKRTIKIVRGYSSRRKLLEIST